MKWLKYLPSLLIIVFTVFLVCSLNKAARRAIGFSEGISFRDFLEPSHTQADPVQEPILPDSLEKIRPYVEETVTGEGYWIPEETYTPEDTLAVTISEVEVETGEKWVRVDIEGKPVEWYKLQHYEREPITRRSTFHFIPVQYSNCEGSAIGAGLAWMPIELWGFDLGIAATAELDPSPEWGTLQGRVSHHIGDSHISIGLDGGYRIGLDHGTAFALDISFDI